MQVRKAGGHELVHIIMGGLRMFSSECFLELLERFRICSGKLFSDLIYAKASKVLR